MCRRLTALATAACIIAFFAGTSPSFGAPAPVTVESIHVTVDGMGRTDPEYLKKTFRQREQAPLDQRLLWKDLKRVRNFQIYRTVTADVMPSPGGVTIDVLITDQWSVIPVLRPTFGADVLHIETGIRDANFLGIAHDLELVSGAYRSPTSRSWLLGLQYASRNFLERHYVAGNVRRNFYSDTFYGPGATVATRVEIATVSGGGEVQYMASEKFQPGILMQISREDYDLLSGIPPVGIPAQPARTIKVGVSGQTGVIEYDRYRYQGYDARLELYQKIRWSGPSSYPGLTLSGRGFWLPHDRINLAGRLLFEATGNGHRLDELAWGGFDRIRGFPDRFLRGRHGALVNLEARVVLFDTLWRTFFVQAATFYDAAAVGDDTIKKWDKRGQSLGFGVRGAIIQAFGFFARFDAAHALGRPELPWDFNLSVDQFF